MEDTSQLPTQRIDKWLWFARIIKTRTLAAKLVSSGKVRLNKERISKPSHPVRSGDTLTFIFHDRPRILHILEPGSRRGPASEAQALYDDLSPTPEEKREEKAQSGVAAREPGSGRPTKKQRRETEKLRDTM